MEMDMKRVRKGKKGKGKKGEGKKINQRKTRKTIEQYQQIIVISLNPRKRGNKLTTNN